MRALDRKFPSLFLFILFILSSALPLSAYATSSDSEKAAAERERQETLFSLLPREVLDQREFPTVAEYNVDTRTGLPPGSRKPVFTGIASLYLGGGGFEPKAAVSQKVTAYFFRGLQKRNRLVIYIEAATSAADWASIIRSLLNRQEADKLFQTIPEGAPMSSWVSEENDPTIELHNAYSQRISPDAMVQLKKVQIGEGVNRFVRSFLAKRQNSSRRNLLEYLEDLARCGEINDDTTITISGHSFGASAATLTAFYLLATDFFGSHKISPSIRLITTGLPGITGNSELFNYMQRRVEAGDITIAHHVKKNDRVTILRSPFSYRHSTYPARQFVVLPPVRYLGKEEPSSINPLKFGHEHNTYGEAILQKWSGEFAACTYSYEALDRYLTWRR